MSGRQALAWVHRNRARVHRDRTRGAGALIERLVDRVRCGEPAFAEEAAGVADADFRRHCRIAGVRRGRLVINVDQPALVYPMRLRWETVLRRALDGRRTAVAVSGVVFEHGKDGVLIGKTPGPDGGADYGRSARAASGGRRK